ncbi:MAG TPA: hypothetical protein GXZ95_05410 [Mollicutes bacterium]|nr:hypothetical protein [Mollicutes bacterium]
MKLTERFKDYIYDRKMSIHIYENKVNIVNYNEISHFNSNKVVVVYDDGNIIVEGKNLVVSKLLDNEILISGKIKRIELG